MGAFGPDIRVYKILRNNNNIKSLVLTSKHPSAVPYLQPKPNLTFSHWLFRVLYAGGQQFVEGWKF